MRTQPIPFDLDLRKVAQFSLPFLFWSILPGISPSFAKPVGSNEIPQEREIHNTFSTNKNQGTILDATNPMDLINRLRQSTAMENATSPSDAIDDALKAFDEQSVEKIEQD